MRVFFAGASGAVGPPAVRELLDRGHEVVAMTSSTAKAPLMSSGCGADATADASAEGDPGVQARLGRRGARPSAAWPITPPLRLRKRTRSQGPSLRRSYPGSAVLCPCPTPARSAAAAPLFLHFLGIDMDFHIRHFRQHGHRAGTGVNASLRLGGWNALNAMHAAFDGKAAGRIVLTMG